MILRLLIIAGFIFTVFAGYSQAGAKAYAGLVTAYSYDDIITPEGHVHSGYVVGIDARLNNERMYFLLGGSYGTMDLISSKSLSYFGGDKLNFVKGRIGLGFDVLRITPKIFITSKFVGVIKYVVSYDKNLLTIPEYDIINDGTATVLGGVGVRVGLLSVDFEYEYGLFNLYSQKKNTRFDYINVTVGVNF
jgi:hypothetical protein